MSAATQAKDECCNTPAGDIVVKTLPNKSSPGLNIGEGWCFTEKNVDQCRLTWTISNFSSCSENYGGSLRSSSFSSRSRNGRKWRLEIFPNGRNSDSGLIFIDVLFVSSNEENVRADVKLSIVNAKREDEHVMRITRDFSNNDSAYNCLTLNRSNVLDEQNGLLPDNTLTVCCRISVMNDIDNSHYQSLLFQPHVAGCRLAEDMCQLLESSSFSDVTLAAGGREFPAHKNLLAARSPVFKAMFEHDMKEREDNRVEIADMDCEVLQGMLQFIYTGKASNVGTMADKLLTAADKYALDPLKSMCEEALCANVSVENAADVLILADLHSADQLKSWTVNFIGAHATEVMETPGWKSISDPRLISDAFRAFASTVSSRHPVMNK